VMRRIVWSEYMSLDGVVDEPGEWSIPYLSDDLAKYKYDELFASDALLLGRITYEGFAAAWPTMEEIEGENNSTVIRGTVPGEVSKLALTYHATD
jgi:dihydrofolate reductase